MKLNSTIQLKFCGLRASKDIEDAITIGANYLGFVFAPQSKRFVDFSTLENINQFLIEHSHLRKKVKTVALFSNASKDEINKIIDLFSPDLLQFHPSDPLHLTNYTGAFCRSFGIPYLRAVPFGISGENWFDYEEEFYDAFALLADSHGGEKIGGTGTIFDWKRIPNSTVRKKRLFLAGGINLSNLEDAILSCQPDCLDISSGIEQAPAIKDFNKMHAIKQQVDKLNPY